MIIWFFPILFMADSAYFNVMNGKVSTFFSQNRKACFTKHSETASDVCGSGGLVAKSCPTLVTYGLLPTRLLCPWNCPGKILEWVSISFPRGSSHPRIKTSSLVSIPLQEDFFFFFFLSLSHQGSPLMYICSQHILRWGFPHNSVKNPPAMHETPVRFLGREDLLQKG